MTSFDDDDLLHCAICERVVIQVAQRRARGVMVCAKCYDRPVTVATAATERWRARTFYVSSLSEAFRNGDCRYVVKRFKQRTTCTCPDFTHRGQVLGLPCKHVRLILMLARAARGWRRIPRGVTLRFRLSDNGVKTKKGAS